MFYSSVDFNGGFFSAGGLIVKWGTSQLNKSKTSDAIYKIKLNVVLLFIKFFFFFFLSILQSQPFIIPYLVIQEMCNDLLCTFIILLTRKPLIMISWNEKPAGGHELFFFVLFNSKDKIKRFIRRFERASEWVTEGSLLLKWRNSRSFLSFFESREWGF